MRIPFANRFRRIAADATSVVGTRLALLGQELQEEVARQGKRLVLLLAFFMFATLGLLCASAFILTLAWQHDHLLAAAACLTLLFMTAGLICVLWLRHNVQGSPPAFAETLAEFKRDELSLRGNDGQTPAKETSVTHTP